MIKNLNVLQINNKRRIYDETWGIIICYIIYNCIHNRGEAEGGGEREKEIKI